MTKDDQICFVGIIGCHSEEHPAITKITCLEDVAVMVRNFEVVIPNPLNWDVAMSSGDDLNTNNHSCMDYN